MPNGMLRDAIEQAIASARSGRASPSGSSAGGDNGGDESEESEESQDEGEGEGESEGEGEVLASDDDDESPTQDVNDPYKSPDDDDDEAPLQNEGEGAPALPSEDPDDYPDDYPDDAVEEGGAEAEPARQTQRPWRPPVAPRPAPIRYGRRRRFQGGGITKAGIRRLARRGGVKRISNLCYDEILSSNRGPAIGRAHPYTGVLASFLESVLKDAIELTLLANRKTLTPCDIVYALKRKNRPLYGFDDK